MKNNLVNFPNDLDQTLIEKANSKDLSTLFQLSLTALINNRIGFAKAFLQQAGNLGHQLAKQYFSILNDPQQSIFLRKQQILHMHNPTNSLDSP